jgi:toxin ParE1/3/4
LKALRYHPAVQRDINEAMRYYLEQATNEISLQFWDELAKGFHHIQLDPSHYHFDHSGLRRYNLKKFPFHFLYEDLEDRVRVQVVRHNLRSPKYGTKRNWG